MNDTYIVIKKGVYRHDIKGAFSTLEEAVEFAVSFCRKEEDDYHYFVIMRLEVDVAVDDGDIVAEVIRNSGGGRMIDQTRWLKVFYTDGTTTDRYF